VEGPGREIASVSPAEIDVREQNIDGLMGEDHLGFLGAGCGHDRKPRLLQGLRRNGAEDQLILHHEDAPAAGLGDLAPVLGWSAQERQDGDHAVRSSFAGSPGQPGVEGDVHLRIRLPLNMVSASLTAPPGPPTVRGF
jgi:hypothetical protein